MWRLIFIIVIETIYIITTTIAEEWMYKHMQKQEFVKESYKEYAHQLKEENKRLRTDNLELMQFAPKIWRKKDLIIQYRKQGLSWNKISDKVGIAGSYLRRCYKKRMSESL